MIQGKAKSFYNNLKQKEGEESKAGECKVSKEKSDNFEKEVWLLKKVTGQAASADQKGTHEFLDAFKKIIKSRQSFGCKTRRPEQQETSGLVPLMLVP